MKDSSYQVKTLNLGGCLHEGKRSSPPSAGVPNASRSGVHEECAKAIREEWPDTPVILATGYAEIAPEEETGLLKLSKPF